jgi:hypothetical protein
VKPAVAARFAELPVKIFESFAVQLASVSVMETVGAATTLTVFDAVIVQPLMSVAVTEYVDVAVGLTEIEAVVAPVVHEYVVNPAVAASVAASPESTFSSFVVQELSVSAIVKTGAGTMVIVCEAVVVQPSAVVAVTE